MNKLYYSKLDGKKFTSEEGLMEHLRNNFMMVDESGGKANTIYKELKEAFPFAKIEVRNLESKGYGEYQVDMTWQEFNADFTFYVGEHDSYCYYNPSFDTVNGAIECYEKFIFRKDEILTKLKERYCTESVSVNQMYEGDMYDHGGMLFSIKVNGKEYFEHYTFGNIDDFVNSFSGYFDKVIEGNVLLEFNHVDGYEEEPRIAGVPIKNILQRAKRVRIEILELKEEN